MASVTITGVNENNFLNIYNNNVVNIYFENIVPEVLKYLEITITRGVLSATFQVTYFPDVAGEYNFKFDLKESFKSLMADSLNNDSKSPEEQVGFDYDLLNEYVVRYDFIYQEPEDDVFYNVSYKAFKSVEQIGETIIKPITNPYLLNQGNITIFKGYPFDFSLYTDTSIALTNENTGAFILYGGVTTGVNRVYLSRGEYLLDDVDERVNFINRVIADSGTFITNPCYTPHLSPILRTGYNDLRINLASNTPLNLKVRLIDACKGVYLKWFNEDGSWSYWLFNNIHKDKISSRVIDVYNTDFESIEQTYFPSLITGKEAKNTLDLTYNALDDHEYNQVKSIITSPRVELFIGNINDDYSLSVANGGADYTKAWTSVRVLNGTITKSNKIGFNDIKISIDKKKYTQS